jgi:hypothetical protein
MLRIGNVAKTKRCPSRTPRVYETHRKSSIHAIKRQLILGIFSLKIERRDIDLVEKPAF